jgi:hypothetical protein
MSVFFANRAASAASAAARSASSFLFFSACSAKYLSAAAKSYPFGSGLSDRTDIIMGMCYIVTKYIVYNDEHETQ